jgi:hypothetical protein
MRNARFELVEYAGFVGNQTMFEIVQPNIHALATFPGVVDQDLIL